VSGRDTCAGRRALEKRVNSLSARLTALVQQLATTAAAARPPAEGAYDEAAAVQRRRRAMRPVRTEVTP
jgi:hypothetical protein